MNQVDYPDKEISNAYEEEVIVLLESPGVPGALVLMSRFPYPALTIFVLSRKMRVNCLCFAGNFSHLELPYLHLTPNRSTPEPHGS